MTRNLLFELGCEELPPKALKTLAEAFEKGFLTGLKQQRLNHGQSQWYATPRRLALHITDLDERQTDKNIVRRGPAVQAAFDGDGQPTKAALGFARSCQTEFAQLERIKTNKGEWLSFTLQEKGQATTALLPSIIEAALKQLPIPKRMRWGSGEVAFVRPVHWAVLLLGSDVVPCQVLGLKTGRTTLGHRFHSSGSIALNSADSYAQQLQDEGHVLVDFAERRQKIHEGIMAAAQRLNGEVCLDEALLDEVTSITEWPMPVAGSFDERFLGLPNEALVAEMQQHQRYFPVKGAKGELLPYFITVSNIESSAPERVKKGNERVIRARLSDAEFFWKQDQKQPLANRLDALNSVLFEASLGTLKAKTQRVHDLTLNIAEALGWEPTAPTRAARLCKCDLLTEMVGEFPELQGLMGRYYANIDGESHEVAQGIEEHYRPRHAGDTLPTSQAGISVALADRMDTLVGIFGIGQKPTGEKDPYALRRASLGILRIIIENKLPLNLKTLFNAAAAQYGEALSVNNIDEALNYTTDRLINYYAEQNIDKDVLMAVLACDNSTPLDIDQRIHAVQAFRALPEADSLTAGNKRINNILKKVKGAMPSVIDENLFEHAAERLLHEKVQALTATKASDYGQRMQQLASLQHPIDQFFEEVMVMADNDALRNNRIALLKQTHGLFMQIADLSQLQ